MTYSNPMGRLFARYLAGQIEESVWKRFLFTLEKFESDPSERSAFITFFDDILVGGSKHSAPHLNRLFSEAASA